MSEFHDHWGQRVSTQDPYSNAVDVLARRHIANAIRDRSGLNLDRALNGTALKDVQARIAEIADEIGNPQKWEFEVAFDIVHHGVGGDS